MLSIREKRHRLNPAAYKGMVICAFAIRAAEGTAPLLDPFVFTTAQMALKEAFEQYRGHCGVYLFMPNHLHLIVSGACAESDLLSMVTMFKQKTAFRVRKTGAKFAWQKDFYDHVIRATEDYGAQVRYLLRNPVRAAFVERWEAWRYRGVLGQTWEQLLAAISSY